MGEIFKNILGTFFIVILYNKQVLLLQKWERFFYFMHNFIKVSTVKEFLLKIKQYRSDTQFSGYLTSCRVAALHPAGPKALLMPSLETKKRDQETVTDTNDLSDRKILHVWSLLLLLSRFSHVRLCATP